MHTSGVSILNEQRKRVGLGGQWGWLWLLLVTVTDCACVWLFYPDLIHLPSPSIMTSLFFLLVSFFFRILVLVIACCWIWAKRRVEETHIWATDIPPYYLNHKFIYLTFILSYISSRPCFPCFPCSIFHLLYRLFCFTSFILVVVSSFLFFSVGLGLSCYYFTYGYPGKREVGRWIRYWLGR